MDDGKGGGAGILAGPARIEGVSAVVVCWVSVGEPTARCGAGV